MALLAHLHLFPFSSVTYSHILLLLLLFFPHTHISFSLYSSLSLVLSISLFPIPFPSSPALAPHLTAFPLDLKARFDLWSDKLYLHDLETSLWGCYKDWPICPLLSVCLRPLPAVSQGEINIIMPYLHTGHIFLWDCENSPFVVFINWKEFYMTLFSFVFMGLYLPLFCQHQGYTDNSKVKTLWSLWI